MPKHIYSHIRDKHDARDFMFATIHAPAPLIALPPKLDLSSSAHMPPVWDQGQLGSCSSHATLAAFTYVHGGGPWSRLEHYYEERLLEGTVGQDSGAMLRDGIKVLADIGVGPEVDWPYDIAKFADAPPSKILGESAQNRIITYSRLTDRNDFRQCLAAGYPFIFGLQLFESFESDDVAQSGVVPIPNTATEQYLGGHALCCVGYNTNIHGGDYYKIRNSWGRSWGDDGYFWLPAKYLENPQLASDFWTIRK